MPTPNYEQSPIIITPPKDLPTRRFAKLLTWERAITFVAFLAAAGQGYYAKRQADLTQGSLDLSRNQLDLARQQFDEAKRQAKEQADAANKQAEKQDTVTDKQLKLAADLSRAAESSAALSASGLKTFKQSVHGAMQPLLAIAGTKLGNDLEVSIANKGRMAAKIGPLWCAGGVTSLTGGVHLIKVWETQNGKDLFRVSEIVPDHQETIRLLAGANLEPGMFAIFPPIRAAKIPFSWTEVCEIPYSDELDSMVKASSHELRFCFYIEYENTKSGGFVSPCTPQSITPVIQDLKGKL